MLFPSTVPSTLPSTLPSIIPSPMPRLRLRLPLALAALLLAGACTTVPKTSAPISTPSASAIETPSVPVNTAEQDALRARVTQQDRLYRVAAPLLINSVDLCKNSARRLLGFTAKNKYSYTSEYVDAAERGFGLGDRLQIMAVLAGSGAAQAGVRAGDGLVAVDDKPMPQGPNAERLAASILGPLMTSKSVVKLTLIRSGSPVAATVPLTMACAFAMELGNADNVNAYSDGHRVMVTRGMLRFVRSDTELAYVIAREMAHSALGHANRLRMSATLGGIIDNLIRVHPDMAAMAGTAGVKPFAQDVDAAADTLSLYMLARAGYDIDGAQAFWQRLASAHPASELNGYTAIHPATGFRLDVMSRVVPQIKSKLATHGVLSP